MGTFIRSYSVDGEEFELYGEAGGRGGFQLVDREGLPVGLRFATIPDDKTVEAVVRASSGEAA